MDWMVLEPSSGNREPGQYLGLLTEVEETLTVVHADGTAADMTLPFGCRCDPSRDPSNPTPPSGSAARTLGTLGFRRRRCPPVVVFTGAASPSGSYSALRLTL